METEHLILRKWTEDDAEEVYRYSKDPAVALITGFPPHQSVEESLRVIRTIYVEEDAYAMVLKETGMPIGCISLRNAEKEGELELGYWLGVPYWGKGLMTEAAREIIRYGFEERHAEKIWCGYYKGNERSHRVIEKVGFKPYCVKENVDVPLLGERRTEYLSLLTRENWVELQQNL